ncbi:SMP-30/gluconolactonase/LRE family protein [Jiulongibacter sediminis]|uniref:SMP-30/gluconolactonase/LRE family protein n=1 Tax=Jiulongibacter sediminis TaxID=1605367 RepID=UPI0026EE9BAE|nr:SMP-30/gluconolactonase/LRE family protein [Jiulongibacter sediminis]
MNSIKVLLLMISLSGNLFAQHKTIGKLLPESDEFYDLIDKNSKVEVLAEGFNWSEGPVWVKDGGYVLFSDVPENTIYKWKEGEGLSVFLKPSGYTGIHPYSLEPGSNGLIVNNEGELVACEHGDRRVTRMPIKGGGGKFPLADNWKGKRFNSPNDIVQSSNGTYYFTDPPYGLPDRENAKTREIDHFGVYMVRPGGEAELVIKDLTRPNGVALSPDEKTLYVAQSDPEKAYILSYSINENGTLTDQKILFDATSMVKAGLSGLPDGLKTDVNGNIFTTGPGGILVLTPEGRLLGRIETGEATANLNWGDDGSTLYITADMYLCRLKTKTIGKGF